jgi:hypothetical protein
MHTHSNDDHRERECDRHGFGGHHYASIRERSSEPWHFEGLGKDRSPDRWMLNHSQQQKPESGLGMGRA